MQTLAQIGIGHLFQTRTGGGLLLFHRRLGGQTALDILLHPAQPAARMGEHAVRLQHRLLILVQTFGDHQVIDRNTKFADSGTDAVDLGQGVIGHGIGHHHPRFMQPDPSLGGTFLPCRAAKQHRLLVPRPKSAAVAGKGAKLGHFRQHHCHDLDGIHLVFAEGARGFGLHHQNPQLFADPGDRHAKERRKDLLAGFGHEAKALFGGGVGGVDRRQRARHAAHQPLAQFHAGFVHGGLVQALGRAKLQRFGIAKQVDRANLGLHAVGDQVGDAVQTVLTLGRDRQRIAQTAQKLAAVAFAAFGHESSL